MNVKPAAILFVYHTRPVAAAACPRQCLYSNAFNIRLITYYVKIIKIMDVSAEDAFSLMPFFRFVLQSGLYIVM